MMMMMMMMMRMMIIIIIRDRLEITWQTAGLRRSRDCHWRTRMSKLLHKELRIWRAKAAEAEGDATPECHCQCCHCCSIAPPYGPYFLLVLPKSYTLRTNSICRQEQPDVVAIDTFFAAGVFGSCGSSAALYDLFRLLGAAGPLLAAVARFWRCDARGFFGAARAVLAAT